MSKSQGPEARPQQNLLLQKCYKEGVKNAQMFSSMNKASGLSFFCSIIDMAEGELERLVATMEGANSNKKAKEWGKFFVSSNDTQIVGFGHVPVDDGKKEHSKMQEDGEIDLNDGKKKVSVQEWGMNLVKVLPNFELMDTDDDHFGFTFSTLQEEEKGEDVSTLPEVFPFKLCDAVVQKSIDFLKEKQLIQTQESEDDECDFAEAAGIEW